MSSESALQFAQDALERNPSLGARLEGDDISLIAEGDTTGMVKKDQLVDEVIAVLSSAGIADKAEISFSGTSVDQKVVYIGYKLPNQEWKSVEVPALRKTGTRELYFDPQIALEKLQAVLKH